MVTIACDRVDRYFSAVVQRGTVLRIHDTVSSWQSDDGKEVSLSLDDNEYIFDQDAPGLTHMVREMLGRAKFVAEDCPKWIGGDAAWPDIQGLLEQLVEAGVLEAGGKEE